MKKKLVVGFVFVLCSVAALACGQWLCFPTIGCIWIPRVGYIEDLDPCPDGSFNVDCDMIECGAPDCWPQTNC